MGHFIPLQSAICLLIFLLSYGFERRSHEATLKIWTDKLVFRFHLQSIGSSISSASTTNELAFIANDALSPTIHSPLAFHFLLVLGAIFAKMKIHIKIIAYWKDLNEFSVSLLLHIFLRSVGGGWLPGTFACIRYSINQYTPTAATGGDGTATTTKKKQTKLWESICLVHSGRCTTPWNMCTGWLNVVWMSEQNKGHTCET